MCPLDGAALGYYIHWTHGPRCSPGSGLHRGTCEKLFWVMLGGLQPANLTQQISVTGSISQGCII